MTSTPEQRFADGAQRYRLDSRIATGGMGEVWRGTDLTLGRTVAVKLLKPEYADDPTFRSRFETEARHAAGLHHPGIAQVFDYGEAAERPYLVMELVDGQPLSAALRPGSPMDPEAARDLLAQAAAALGVAHAAGIVHRDVKPANLMLTRDRTIKVTDFGIARAAEGMALTGTGQVMGTPQYLSPEQARGETATAASDVYALGVVAYECLVGRRPFEADSPVATALAHLREPVPALPGSVPAGLAAVVTQALAKKPAERFRDGAALAAALQDPSRRRAPAPMPAPVPVPEGTQVLPTTSPVPPATASTAASTAAAPPPPGRSGGLAWLLVGLLVGALLIGGLVWWTQRDTAGEEQQPTRDRAPSQSPTRERSPSEEPTPTETEATTIEVDADDYVGLSAASAESRLRQQGLEVTRDEIDNPGDEEAGTVASVDPTGTLEEGDLVTLEVWGPAPEPTPTEPTTEPTEPTGEPTPTTPTPTTPTETTAPGGPAGPDEAPSTSTASSGGDA